MRGRHPDVGVRACREQRRDAIGHGAAGGDDVIHEQARSPLDLSDDMGHRGIGVAQASLVQHNNRSAEVLSVPGRHFHSPDIGRDDHEVGRQPVLQRAAQRRHGRQTVNRSMEEAFDLGRVQIDGDDVVNADHLEKIGDHAGHDWLPPAMPLVRSPVAEVGNDRRHARCPGPAAGIREGYQLDQVIINRGRGRLHEKELVAAHRFEKLHRNVPIRVALHGADAELGVQLLRDRCGQRRVSSTREYCETHCSAACRTHQASGRNISVSLQLNRRWIPNKVLDGCQFRPLAASSRGGTQEREHPCQ